MPSEVAARLVALALQKLEALQANEAEVLSDEKCLERATEVAETALQSIAVCTKYLLAKDGEARIPGLGLFHLEKEQIQFVPDSDVLQYTLLKHREADQLQLSLRDAFVAALSQLKELLPLLDLSSGEPLTTSESLLHYDVAEHLFEPVENDFGRSVSNLINHIVAELREAGVRIEIDDVERIEVSDVKGKNYDEIAEALEVAQEKLRNTGLWGRWKSRGRATERGIVGRELQKEREQQQGREEETAG